MNASERRIVFGALPVAAVAGSLTTALLFGGARTSPVIAQSTAQLSQEQRATATSLEGAFVKVADTVSPATVYITADVETRSPRVSATPRRAPSPFGDDDNAPFGDLFGSPSSPFRAPSPRQGRASGSGVVVRPDGYILTNDHVVENAKDGKVKVTLSDQSVYTGRVFRDQRSDLAVVKIDAPKPLPFVRLADSNALHVGQWAVAIGSPFGQQNTMTAGIVSALHRKSEIGGGEDARYYPNLIQTDASINPGNSGGPLLNINGELIGVNVAIYSPSGSSAGIGFAIPSNTAKTVMNQLIATGKVTRGYLGLAPTDIPANLRTALGASKGARVASLNSDSPAAQAGIAAGDIITRFGSSEIEGESDLREAIASAAPGARVPVTLLRNGSPRNVTVTVGTPPAEDGAAPAPRPAVRPTEKVGIQMGTLTPDARKSLQLPAATTGVLVEAVASGSVASDAGLFERDIITNADGKPVATPADLARVLSGFKTGDVVTMTVVRPSGDGKTFQVVVDVTIP